MENYTLMKQGAEARIYQGTYLGRPAVFKERFKKTYRNETLDINLTNERIKAESRAIVRCKAHGIRTPTLYLVDLKRRLIVMEYFENSTILKEFIEATEDEATLTQLSLKIGQTIGKMHENNIIHGDLTSSNILLVNKDSLKQDLRSMEEVVLVLIDFGLGYVESSAEDKGVDLYVLERALLSTHKVAEILFPVILQGYKDVYKNKQLLKDVMHKYEEVRARGRKRTMVG